MARKRSAPVALAAGRPSLVAVLDEDAQVEVLHAANADRVLAALSSSCKQLCRLARSRIPVKLQVTTPTHAGLVIQSYARGGPPFSACTELSVAAYTPASCLITVNVLNAAQQWTALAHVELVVQLSAERLQPNQTLDYCSSGILSALPALRRLRHLKLHVQEFGACSARQLGQLVQLTRLELNCTGSAAADAVPPDLAALAGMTSLVDLVLGEPAVQPAAGTAGPFCFPSSLTFLDIRDPEDQEGYAACIARCLTHLPGCPHLQELRLLYSYNQHASAHPSAVVRLLAQHNRQLRMLAINSTGRDDTVWDVEVPGLPEPGGPVDREWRPDASLAVLTGLQCLDGGQLLYVRHQEDWQHLAQLTALSKLACFEVIAAPPPQAGLTLSVLELERCLVQLGGHDLGRLLLACPCLQRASIWVWGAPAAAAASQATQRLSAHPSLQSVELEICSVWNHTWNGIGWRTAAAAQLAALAPLLGGGGVQPDPKVLAHQQQQPAARRPARPVALHCADGAEVWFFPFIYRYCA